VPHAWGVGAIAGVVEAVLALDVEVVLALGDVDTSALGQLPSNVRVTAGCR
jgi:calicheamicinone 4-hydroxyamino-4,6-dideoxy-alpha-D-glucosyltransferase